MKRVYSFILISLSIIVLVLSVACSNSITNSSSDSISKPWTEDDFQFYDSAVKVKLFPTIDDYWIRMEKDDELLTNRGIEIGDRAIELTKNYDLKDFDWSIVDWSKLNPSTDKSEEYEAKLKLQKKSVTDIISYADEISGAELGIYLSCDIYKEDGKLITISDLKYSQISQMTHSISNENMTKEIAEKEYQRQHLKYRLFFSIDNAQIIEVSIESNYHNHLSISYNTKGDFIGEEWVLELGN